MTEVYAIAAQLRLRQTGLVAVDATRLKAAGAGFGRTAALAGDPRHPERSDAPVADDELLSHGRCGPDAWAADPVVTGALSVLREVALRPALAVARVELPAVMADWLRGPGASALAALDRPVELVVSSDAPAATLIEAPR